MKTAIVTGTSGNLGQAVVKKYLAENFAVEGAGSLSVDSPHYHTVAVNLTDEIAAGQWIQSVISRHATIDVAVLTVGGFEMNDIAHTNSSAIAKQIQLNFETAYNVARPVFAQMLKQGRGRIFLIGSKAGLDMKNSKGMVAYGLSKSLLFRLAEMMNDEAVGTGVKTVVIVPSTIDTLQNRAAMPGADFSKWQTPEFIADIIFSNCITATSGESVIIL
ncbi:MAG TPA: SDR family NAD(P)-dependent oxidoreductase [Chitinophagaceae bacterium]|nr:SDR family NAD(P)-dependent oxidoreductase [Chitinophagaceae bacterium]HNU14955.1 SDR family NAD(P)-dependent oxidoreductase [Chitinophagaceae bacterium]